MAEGRGGYFTFCFELLLLAQPGAGQACIVQNRPLDVFLCGMTIVENGNELMRAR